MSKQAKTNFGFSEVPLEEKQGMVGEIFSSVASKYDLMNDLMSLGMHRLWKNHFVKKIPLKKTLKVLDMAAGTGDIAFRIKQNFPHAKITLSDINAEMLEVSKARAIDKGILHDLNWQVANAEKLDFKNNSFDVYTIVFGIRNVTDIEAALNEAHRVLKPGGVFLCMEFSMPENELLAKIYDKYSFNVIPFVGEKITQNRAAYQYLVESIRKFPDKKTFASMIKKSGFTQASFESLAAGAVAIHKGWKV